MPYIETIGPEVLLQDSGIALSYRSISMERLCFRKRESNRKHRETYLDRSFPEELTVPLFTLTEGKGLQQA